MPPTPAVRAILTCDQIIHEFGTNKKSLIGIFEDIHLVKFPATHPHIAVYVNLTDAHGTYIMGLAMFAPDGKEVARVNTPPVTIDTPLRTCEFALQMQNTPFAEPGKYEFQIFANDELLATKSINARKATMPPGGQQIYPPPAPPPDA